MHNKKLLVLAVSAVFAAPCAFAQKGGGGKGGDDADSVVTLYGKIYPEVVRPSGDGATEAGTTGLATFAGTPTGRTGIIRRNEMESGNSRFGVRGHEKLGAGVKAIFQLETEFHVDSNDSRFAQRDSYVGLAHDRWGTVKLGRMDTPYKGYGDEISFLGISSGNITSTSNVMRTVGFGGSSSASFHLRRQNVVQYESPKWGPVDFAVQYSNNETDTATRKPHVWSGGVKWESGPIAVTLAHEMHWDLFGLSNNVPTAMSNVADQAVRSKDKATQASITYKWGSHQFEFDANQKEYKENASLTGKVQSYKNNAYLFIWDARWSDRWRTQVHYIKATKGSCSRVSAVCTTDGLNGSQVAAGFAYYFSKKTYLFAMATYLRNGSAATYNNLQQQAPAVGEDITQYAAGIHTIF